VANWLIFYDNGHKFSSEDGSWEDAPNEGVQVVVVLHLNQKPEILRGADYYACTDGSIRSFSKSRFEKLVKQHCKPIKFGRWMGDEDFQALLKSIKEEYET
jgi:hypothetical protein